MSNKFKLTAASVKGLAPDWYWDTEDRGFLLIVRERSATFSVQKDVRGRTVRVKIGCYPTWTVEQARKKARELMVQMDQGVNPNAAKREARARGTTLREALGMHVTAMKAKRCAPRSPEALREELERHASDWLDRPLADIRPQECAARHARLTEKSGPYAANRVLQAFRACWNTAARALDDLPACPTRAVTFNKVRRRREPIPWDKLPAWRRAVEGIDNPIRRDLQLFTLLTGLRSSDAKTVRWEHVDFDKGTLHRPKPKGGEDRAFTVPVSAEVLAILKRRRDENVQMYARDNGWAFPSRDMDGGVTHVAQTKEQRYVGGKKVTAFPSPHRLRDTFATAAHEAGVNLHDLKVLMNHSLPGGDVTMGYVRVSVEHLRAAAEKISAFLVEKMGPAA